MKKVVVTGLGIVSPLGVGIKHNWKNLISGKSGIVALDHDEFRNIPSKVAGKIPLGSKDEGKWDPADWLSDKVSIRRIPLFAQYAIAATEQALTDASWKSPLQHDRDKCGVAVGSGIGGIDDFYENSIKFHTGDYHKVSPLFIPNLLSNMAAGHISMINGFRGPNHCVSTACTTGCHAIGDAFNFIRLGMANVMIAGSTEAPIHPVAVAGFARAKSLSTKFNEDPAKASRPFDGERNGFVIAEGSGIMILEELEHALERNAKIYAEVCGYGLSGDAHHITAPIDNGDGAYRSMKMALETANMQPDDIDYINAHATSTKLGDEAESIAITNLFSTTTNTDATKDAHEINVSSTKGATGHLLGGSGSIEAIYTVLALQNNILPPTINLHSLDTNIFKCNYVPNTAQSHSINVAISNSFGFGGTNATILFKKFARAR